LTNDRTEAWLRMQEEVEPAAPRTPAAASMSAAPDSASVASVAAGTPPATAVAPAASTLLSGVTAPAQPVLGARGLLVFLALLSAFGPLSTDLYLPSLPAMTGYFGVAESLVNLTLIVFFVCFALSSLVWGPLSDKYGRRPIVLTGFSLYAVASLGCAASADVYQLILFRALQAIGGGAGTVAGTAIVKDVYRGRRRENTLAIVQSMVLIAPAVAPAIGAGLLTWTSWRGVFVTQAAIGALVVAGAVVFRETIESRRSGGVAQALGRLVAVARNPAFTTFLAIFALTGIALMSFIGGSSYIYQDEFGLSSGAFSLFFAFNALAMLSGPLLYVFIGPRFPRFAIVTACFGTMALSGAAVVAFGETGPFVFAPLLVPATIANACSRPPGVYLMLSEAESDAGSASALISSYTMIMGSVGITLVSLIPGPLVHVVGSLNLFVGVVCLVAWLVATRLPLLAAARAE
jgi:DHA1 family bicyclomycin/chloramphenicol resistance-like MFS transporter